MTADIIVPFVAAFDKFAAGLMTQEDLIAALHDFNRERMRAYAYLSMLASQPVIDALDVLVEHMFRIVRAEKPYQWPDVRADSLKLLNAMRADLGLMWQVSYSGGVP